MLPAIPSVVLDTNVVLDWFVFGNPGVAQLARAIETGRLRWLGCARMRDELAHVIAHGALSRHDIAVEQVLTSALQWQTTVDLPPRLPLARLRCRDASDQVFLDLALHAGARWLISRDRALLALRRKAAGLGLAIMTPEQWPPEALPRAQDGRQVG
jgi:putative PIN family toxin of toxin-antitoxin system